MDPGPSTKDAATLLPRRTARLVLRPLGDADIDTIVAYRNDPEVNQHQEWSLPQTPDDVRELIDEAGGRTTLAPGTWIQLGVEHDGELIGDVYVGLALNGGVVELGYTIARHAQGHGFGREAVGAMVDALFDEVGVHRVSAGVDPGNDASMRLLEHLGFEYEGTFRQAFLHRGVWADDIRYGLTKAAHAAWRARPTRPAEAVTLIEITPDTSFMIGKLATHHSQQRFVATVFKSYADALFPEADPNGGPALPWLRAIGADGEPVGFVMVSLPSPTQEHPYLWRLLIDRRHQRRGIGQRTIALLAEHFRAEGATALDVSWVPGRGSPEAFYRMLGFAPTGEIVDGEVEARLDLTSPPG